jgi:hypothetical protein
VTVVIYCAVGFRSEIKISAHYVYQLAGIIR